MAEDAVPGEEPAAEQTTRTPAAPARRRVPRYTRGTCIGRYVVIDVIGAGGMGVVYRAYDPELDRRIALKLVKGRRDPGTLVAEAQALARVSHPNVVHVYDVGTFGDQVFIAMELVEGKTVHQWRALAKPSRRELLDVFLAAGRGLAAAHRAGIVHRDFKPSNVMVGDDGRVKVADFGLARAGDLTPTPPLDPSTISGSYRGLPTGASRITPIAESPHLTDAPTEDEPTSETIDERPPHEDVELQAMDTATSLPRVIASRVMGTPSYMAPEQRRTGIYDARVDQYAFAVALYETIYGERPFAGATDADLVTNALTERIRPAPKGADVPAHLRRTIVRALKADPADRFPSMDALLEALAFDPARRRRRAIGALAALAIAGVLVWALARGGHGDPCADVRGELAGAWDDAVAARVDHALRATGRTYAPGVATRVAAALGARADEWTRVRGGVCRASARGEISADLLDRQTACLDRRAGELRALTAELARGPDPALLDHALDAIAALPATSSCADRTALLAVPPPGDPVTRAKVTAIRAQLASTDAATYTGAYLAARDRAAGLVDDARAIGYTPLVAEALVTAGGAARRATDFAHAEAYLGEAVTRAAAARDDALAAEAWVDLVGVIGFDQGRTLEGKALSRAADAAVARTGGASAGLRARLLDAEALLASGTGDLDAAIAREREALVLREEDGDDVAIAESTNDLALLTSERGDYAGAEALHRRALALRQKALGPAHPLVADSLDNLGVVVYHQGRLDEARGFYEEALALRTAAFGPEARDVATSLNNLGGLYMDLGDRARATDHLERALAIWEKVLGPTHPDLAIPLSNLADLANQGGDHARAKTLCTRALAIDSAAHGDDAATIAYDLVCLGEAELTLAPTDARAHLERALALREKAPGDAGELARTRFDLAQALAATGGDHRRAHDLAVQACQSFDTLAGTWTPRRDACTAWLRTH